MTEPAPSFVELDWDSRFFRRRIARATQRVHSRADLDDLFARARTVGVECLYLLTDPDAAQTISTLQTAGFAPVDVRVTFEGPTQLAQSGEGKARAATAADVPEMRQIATRGHHGARFYSDGRFPRSLCDALYAEWIERSVLHGFADHVLTMDAEGGLAGYVTCSLLPDGVGSIGLLAVDERVRGRGYGRNLVLAALDWLGRKGAARARVVTQGGNAAAKQLYRRCGMAEQEVKLWYHLWLEGSTDSRIESVVGAGSSHR